MVGTDALTEVGTTFACGVKLAWCTVKANVLCTLVKSEVSSDCRGDDT